MPAEDPYSQIPDDNDSVFKGENWLSARIVNFIAGATPRCVEVTRLLSEGMDRPLPWWTYVKLRLHFLVCTYCKRYGEHLRFLRHAGHHYCEHSDEASGEQMPPEARQQIKQMLRDVIAGQ
jgi:uncharacterized membrane protein